MKKYNSLKTQTRIVMRTLPFDNCPLAAFFIKKPHTPCQKKSVFCLFWLKINKYLKDVACLPPSTPHMADKTQILKSNGATVLVNNILNKKNIIYMVCIGWFFVRWSVRHVGWQVRKSDFVRHFLGGIWPKCLIIRRGCVGCVWWQNAYILFKNKNLFLNEKQCLLWLQ